MVLTKVAGIGEIKLSDVADITVVDNSGESYSKSTAEQQFFLQFISQVQLTQVKWQEILNQLLRQWKANTKAYHVHL